MDAELTRACCAASWCLQRLARPDGEGPGSEWVHAAVGELPTAPPFGVVVDVGMLLTRPDFDARAGWAIENPRLRAAVDGYTEHVLGRLAGDPHLEDLRDVVATLDSRTVAETLAVVCDELLARLGFSDGMPSAVARRVVALPREELLSDGVTALQDTPEVAEALAVMYEALAAGARRCGDLLAAADATLARHFEALRHRGDRMALQQIMAAAEAIEDGLPRKVKSRFKRAANVATRLEEESTYPVGGYASIATWGSIENMVSSELAYIEDGKTVDPFDVRWASGELLRYTRDEGIFVRGARTPTLLLGADLESCRFKDPGPGWQRMVIALGFAVAAVRRLAAWLDTTELTIRIVVFSEDEQPLSKELALLELALAEWVEAGVVVLERRAELREEDLPDARLWLTGAPHDDAHGPSHSVQLGGPRVSFATPDGERWESRDATPEQPVWHSVVEGLRRMLLEIV